MKKEVKLDRREAYEKSLQVLKACASDHGFIASAFCKGNYCNVWGRDSMICSLAALMTGDEYLIDQVKKSLKTLMKYQYKHGQIPSNVNIGREKVSYGGSVGRIDSNLWFLIGFGQYVKTTKNKSFLKKYYSSFKKSIERIHGHDFNEKDLLYVPTGGDWADEYVQQGYVLYDQLLYYCALNEDIYLSKLLRKSSKTSERRMRELKRKIDINYSPNKRNINSEEVYQKVWFEKALGMKAEKIPYLLPSFDTGGYDYHFDSFANSLAIEFGLVKGEKARKVIRYIKKNFSDKTNYVLPSFSPVITRRSQLWKELKNNYSVKFRNKPYKYQNGGLWTMITGFYISALKKYDGKLALHYLDGLNNANKISKGRNEWGFYEYLHGKKFKPGGSSHQAWSAAAGIIGYETAVNKKRLFL